jgi:hypothetical protein
LIGRKATLLARVVELVDTGDLKSPAHRVCRFNSGPGHHYTAQSPIFL